MFVVASMDVDLQRLYMLADTRARGFLQEIDAFAADVAMCGCSLYVVALFLVLDCSPLEHNGGGNYKKTSDVMTSPGAKGRS